MRICFDLDGTLCSLPPYEEAEPFWDRIDIVNELYARGHYIIINTARGSMSGKRWVGMTKRQLERWGVRYHELHVGSKPSADLYIDDKCVTDVEFFEGEKWEQYAP